MDSVDVGKPDYKGLKCSSLMDRDLRGDPPKSLNQPIRIV